MSRCANAARMWGSGVHRARRLFGASPRVRAQAIERDVESQTCRLELAHDAITCRRIARGRELSLELRDVVQQRDLLRDAVRALEYRIGHAQMRRQREIAVEIERLSGVGQVIEFSRVHGFPDSLLGDALEGHGRL